MTTRPSGCASVISDATAERLVRFFARLGELMRQMATVEAARQALREYDEDEANEEKAA
jgi:predicted hydrolase (HD superfamily)